MKSDMTLLPADAKDHSAYPYFLKAMDGMGYGHDPLNQAWYFFRIGWEAQAKAFEDGVTLLTDWLNRQV